MAQYDLTVINLGYLEIVSHYWKGFLKYVDRYTLLFHVHDENDTIKTKHKTLLRKWILQAKYNLFASSRTRDFLEQQLSIRVPNANTLINPLSFAAPNEKTPYPPPVGGTYRLAMLAALDVRRKAQDNLVKVLSSPKWKERNWQLRLFGTGADEDGLRNQISEAGMIEKILLEGHTKNVKSVLEETHILLQITHIDAMPLAVMEALAMARPVIVSDVGDMPEWVSEGVNGWISRDASVEAIDQTLEKAWQKRESWPRMGEASFGVFKEKFPACPEAFFLSQLLP